MSIETNDRPHQTRWTLPRIINMAATLVMISALGELVPVASAATPEAANANATASAPAVTTASPALPELPPPITVAPLKNATGASFTLAEFFGKVMVINLWATWCGPCRQEIPELVRLNKEFHSRGVEMIGLSIEYPDASAEKVRKFIQDFQIDYRIGWAPPEVAAGLMQGHNAVPQILIISRDAFIVKHFVGFSPANTPAELKQAIEAALN